MPKKAPPAKKQATNVRTLDLSRKPRPRKQAAQPAEAPARAIVAPAQRGHRPGRPSKMTPEVVDLFCAMLKAGLTIRDAALTAGISEQCVHGWKHRANLALQAAGVEEGQEIDADEVLRFIPEQEHRFVEFLWRFQTADSNGVGELAARIHRSNDPAILLRMLKMRRPEQFQERQQVDLTGSVKIESPRLLLDERLDRIRARAIEADSRETPDALPGV